MEKQHGGMESLILHMTIAVREMYTYIERKPQPAHPKGWTNWYAVGGFFTVAIAGCSILSALGVIARRL